MGIFVTSNWNGCNVSSGGTIEVVCPTQAPSGPFDTDGTAELNGGTVAVNGSIVTEISEGGRF
ncbi:MAG: hypothetical protein JXX29_03650 [Deltaproteobacteria bacterium]|nr:hypothetical protein [Deltaproteobacteria bacterium]MBN2670737.1 hypothetical protein [Deltaproteobacteria bacterium]